MIIPLTNGTSSNRWVNPELTMSLCGGRLSEIGAPKNGRCNMTIRLKNPRQTGFVKVKLTKGSFNDDRYPGWHWQDSLGVYKKSINIFLTDTERYIDEMFSGLVSVTIWVKFEKA